VTHGGTTGHRHCHFSVPAEDNWFRLLLAIMEPTEEELWGTARKKRKLDLDEDAFESIIVAGES